MPVMIIIMKANYQFSFNPNLKENGQQQVNLITCLQDLFPYLTMQSSTSCLLGVQILFFLLSMPTYTLFPNQEAIRSQKNVFVELARNLIYSIMIGRMGSQYQSKLGYKYYLSVLAATQSVRFILVLVLGSKENILLTNSPTIFSLYILAMINIKKWKQNEAVPFKQQQKIENYDLLDLNDTIIKLKTNENVFMYQSYTNRQFYYHNLNQKQQKIPKHIGKHSKRSKKSSKFIQNISEQEEQNTLKLFKYAFIHFMIYSNYQIQEFLILLVGQIMIYVLMTSKILKRVNLT